MKTPEDDLDLYEPDEPAGVQAARAVVAGMPVRRPRLDLRPGRATGPGGTRSRTGGTDTGTTPRTAPPPPA